MYVLPVTSILGGWPWFGPGIQGLFRSAIRTGAATARIDTTVTWPGLTPVLEVGTDAPCTS